MDGPGAREFRVCPCGVEFVGKPEAVQKAFRCHSCDFHGAEGSLLDEPLKNTSDSAGGWQVVVISLGFFLLLSFLCTHGWGLIK